MCQCPNRATSLFYSQIEEAKSNGAMCQCPDRAASLFYKDIDTIAKDTDRDVSMP